MTFEIDGQRKNQRIKNAHRFFTFRAAKTALDFCHRHSRSLETWQPGHGPRSRLRLLLHCTRAASSPLCNFPYMEIGIPRPYAPVPPPGANMLLVFPSSLTPPRPRFALQTPLKNFSAPSICLTPLKLLRSLHTRLHTSSEPNVCYCMMRLASSYRILEKGKNRTVSIQVYIASSSSDLDATGFFR